MEVRPDPDGLDRLFVSAPEWDAAFEVYGACPVQAVGTVRGRDLYFRARHGEWSFDVANRDGHLPSDGYQDVVRYLGGRRLEDLTGLDVTRMYRAMEEDGHSTATRRSVGRLLRQALADACTRKYVRENAARQVPVPRHHKADIHPLTPAEVSRLLDSVRGDRLYALIVVALDSGARVGELLALEWSDWDSVTRELSITKTLVVHKGKPPYARQPKTPSSRRRVLLSRTAAAALEVHRAQAAGQLIFGKKDGSYYRPDAFSRDVFSPARSRAGLPGAFSFHDLRHTCATLLLMSGVDVKTVSEGLGHANVTMTLRVYAHVLPAMRQKAAAVLDGFLGGADGGSPCGGSKLAVNPAVAMMQPLC